MEKQFLAGYLCASLYYLIEDGRSRQILFADREASTAITTALLAAASSTAVMVRAHPFFSHVPVPVFADRSRPFVKIPSWLK